MLTFPLSWIFACANNCRVPVYNKFYYYELFWQSAKYPA